MRLITSYPVTDLGTEPQTLQRFAQGVEEMGYQGLLLSEHVLGADLKPRPDWKPYNHVLQGPGAPIYDHGYPFFDPFVAFGFLAAVTSKIKLGTGVLVLGMRQTALVAKQAAIADVMSGGRLILAIGSGWNDVEYEAMGVDFHTRGRRVDEQMALLRALWTQDVVSFEGKFHTVRAAGINPLPVQRPIPLWIAGTSDAAVKRAALLGDGYYPGMLPDDAEAQRLARLRKLAAEAGRDPSKIAVLGAVTQGPRDPERMVKGAKAWEALGAGWLTVRTSSHPMVWPREMRAAERSAAVDRHLDSLRRFKSAWDSRS
jgi:probable F420-dependent oxidoreductase